MTENLDKRIELAKELIESLRALIEKSRETRARNRTVWPIPERR
jgi:hypothetical protein